MQQAGHVAWYTSCSPANMKILSGRSKINRDPEKINVLSGRTTRGHIREEIKDHRLTVRGANHHHSPPSRAGQGGFRHHGREYSRHRSINSIATRLNHLAHRVHGCRITACHNIFQSNWGKKSCCNAIFTPPTSTQTPR